MGAASCHAEGPDRTAIVFAGGDPPDPAVRDVLPADAYVIAADSGLDHADHLGVSVHRVVGDFDSVTSDALDAAAAAGARIDRYPTAKDATDLELALDAARAQASRIIVVGGDGGRLDHLLSIALLLGSAAYADRVVVAYLGPATVHVIRSATTLTGVPGELISLLALHGPAHGVRTSGLQYPLHDETLHPGSSRGVSNEFTGSVAQVAISAGVLLAVQPSHLR